MNVVPQRLIDWYVAYDRYNDLKLWMQISNDGYMVLKNANDDTILLLDEIVLNEDKITFQGPYHHCEMMLSEIHDNRICLNIYKPGNVNVFAGKYTFYNKDNSFADH